MARFTPDPTFYATAREAAGADPEKLAYVVTLNPGAATGSNGDGRPDALCTVDLDGGSGRAWTACGRRRSWCLAPLRC